ncbi:hypothetical protein C8J57DRAFT_1525702 [Mycena rebaudengoi]|nr:hypothetical protein C8J57DRAFT_1525702 [Mycena rebaudengoi]
MHVLEFPPEITTEIFELCLDPRSKMSLLYAPLVFCHICIAWRTLAIGTPSLWCALEFPACVEELLQWVKRSRSRPLMHRFRSLNLTDARDLVLSFSQFSARWREVELSLPEAGFQLMQATSQTSFPLLRKISLRRVMGPRRYIGGSPPPIYDINDVPQLTEAYLELRPSMSVCLPWEQLISLEIHCPVQDMQDILLTSTRLRNLTHHDRPSRLLSPPPPHILAVPSLESLVLPHSPLVLLRLSLPALTHLSMPLALEQKYPGSLESLFQRSHCSVVHLCIRIQEESETALHAVLSAAHGVTELELQFYRGARTLAQMHLLQAPNILPELRVLTVKDRSDSCHAFYPIVHFEFGEGWRRVEFGEHKSIELELCAAVHARASQLTLFSLVVRPENSAIMEDDVLEALHKLASDALKIKVEMFGGGPRHSAPCVLIDT